MDVIDTGIRLVACFVAHTVLRSAHLDQLIDAQE